MLVPLESSSAVLAMIRSKSVPICNRFRARLANSCKITISKGVPLFDALVRGESPHPVAQITSLETRYSRLPYGEDPESLSHLGLVRHRIVTDRQTDRQTESP